MLRLLVVHSILFSLIEPQTLYNHNSATYRNQTWMSTLDDGVPLRQLTIIGTHSSMSTGTWGDAFQTQGSSLATQLASGMRALDIRCRHYQNSFPIHQRLIYLNVDLGGVLSTVQTFLSTYPSQTVLMHIVEEYNPSGNSRSFEDTFISYKNTFSSLIWTPTTQNPTLGMTRGKVVIIQNFAGAVHGLLYGSFTTIQHKNYGTNWDQHDRWLSIKSFISATSVAKTSRISFWSGSVGSFPYFCASGKSSPQNGAPRLVTGLTTPGFSSYYPDFPRVGCFIGICTIPFQGINILASNYLNSNGFAYWGIVFTDFAGDVLISTAISKNAGLFGKCTATQLSQGCTACSTAGLCIACNDILHYIFDSATSTCKAATGYFLNSSFIPQLCSSVMPGCLQCSSGTNCILCDTFLNYQLLSGQCDAANGYYLDSISIPVKCNILGCYLCSSATVCTNCSAATNFVMDINGDCICDSSQNFMMSPASSVCICTAGLFLSPNGTCQPIPLCPANNSGCITCVSNVCTLCDAPGGFYSSSPYCLCMTGLYYDGVGCQVCNVTQPPCVQCLSPTLCLQCVDNFTLIQGVCSCMPQFYQFDTDTCLQCTVGCLSCSGPGACTICDTNVSFVLISGLCQCTPGKYVDLANFGEQCVPCGAMPGCLNCNMAGCLQCDPILGFSLSGIECVCDFGYYISPMAVCTQCRIQGCLDCDTQTNCIVCDNSSYYLDSTGICLQICGDGKLFNLGCDDGNLIDGDGCSSTCQVQTDFTCSGGSSTTPSACSFSGEVKITLQSYIKDINMNKVTIKLKFQPNIPVFNSIDFQQCILPNFPIASRTTQFNSQNGQIVFEFNYDQPLNTNQNMSVSFQPPANNLQFYYTPSKLLSLPYTTDNNLALKSYPSAVYQMIPYTDYLVYAVMALSLLGFLFAIIFSSRLIGVQMMMVVQIAFIGLMSLDKLQSLLFSFVQLWPVNGYNALPLADKQGSQILPRFTVLHYKSFFLPNFNLDFLLVLAPFLIGLAVYLYSRKKQDKQLKQKSFVIYKQLGFTMLLFVQLHLFASIFIGIKYGIQQIYAIALGGIIIVLLIVMAVLLIRRPKNFGDYKNFFHSRCFHSNFYVFVIASRFVVGACIPAFTENIFGICIAIGVIGFEMLILLIFRPYKNNIRPFFNSSVIIITLGVYLAYKIKIIDEALWITTYIPLFLILILLACVIVNILLLIRHKFCDSQENMDAKVEKYYEAMEFEMNSETRKNIEHMQESPGRLMTPTIKQAMDNPTMNILKEVRLDISMLRDKPIDSRNFKDYEGI